MADAWLPGAGRVPARRDGGALQGGAPRVVWLASESDPRTVSARSVAADLIKEDRPAHLVWNPATGELLQLLPATRAGRLLGERVGREGRVCVQIVVVGQARAPFTGTLLVGLDAIIRWLDDWGIARRWPAGPPLSSPQSYHSRRGRREWARGGHFGASQVPELDRPDPGGIDIRSITGPDTPVSPIPKARPVPQPAAETRLITRVPHPHNDPPLPASPPAPSRAQTPVGQSISSAPAGSPLQAVPGEPVPVGPSASSS